VEIKESAQSTSTRPLPHKLPSDNLPSLPRERPKGTLRHTSLIARLIILNVAAGRHNQATFNAAATHVEKEFGGLNVLINNADITWQAIARAAPHSF
jgi:NAD(P)-dependent dehydrogenase (short-subunit alcohol dehydrogenase family)